MPADALRRRRPFLLGSALVAAFGCGERPTFVCDDDSACGTEGRCEATGYCSFPDAACELGRRYGEHAPPSLSGACVEPDAIAGTDTNDDPTRGTTGGDATATGSGSAESSGAGSTSDTTPGGDGTTLPGESSTAGDSSGGSTKVTIGPLLVETDLDDGAIWPAVGPEDGVWLPSGETMPGFGFMGEYPDGRAYYGYFRFRLPTAIPEGAIVSSVLFEVRGWAVYQWNADVDALRVSLQLSADAPQVGGLGDYPDADGPVVLADASARWPDEGPLVWDTDLALNAAPDLAPLFQGLVAATGGIDADAHVQLWVAADALGLGGREVGWIDAGRDADEGARLTIELELP